MWYSEIDPQKEVKPPVEIERSDAVVSRVMGRIGNVVYTRKGKKRYVARGTYKGEEPSKKQEVQRLIYHQCDNLWADLTEHEKNEWKAVTHGKGHTRYSSFMKCNLLRGGRGLPLKRVP